MKLFYFIPLLLLTSCHTPAENMAIEYVKRHCKSPSSFTLEKVESMHYDEPKKIESDTIYYLKGNNIYHTKNTSLSLSKKPKNISFKYDSISYHNRVTPPRNYVWVDVSFEAKNSFGVPLSGNESIIIYNGRAMPLIDFVDLGQYNDNQPGPKLLKPEKITRPVYDFSLY